MAETANLTVRIGANISEFEKKMQETQKNFDKLGGALKTAGKGMTAAVTAPIVAIGGAAFAAANDFDKAYNQIQVQTGATGDDLAGLEKNFKSVFRSIPVDSETASSAIASLNSSTGATGETLEGMTTSVLEASRMMGEDGAANAEAFGRAMNQWQIPAEEGEQAMDRLFKASQEYDIGMGDLMGTMSAYGPVLQNAGFEMHEAADLFARLEDSGISVSRVMPGLNSAFRNWASEGKDAREEFDKVVAQMQDAETETEALSIATEAFGAEGAQRLTTAIRNGVIPSTDELGDALEDSEGAISDLSEETMTVGDRFQLMKNRIQEAIAPLGEVFMDILEDLEPFFMDLIGWIEDLGKWFSDLSPAAQRMVIAIGGIAAAIGPLLVVAGTLISSITKIGAVFKLFTPVVAGVGKAFALLSNPVGWVIAIVGALIAVFTYLWNTNEGFRNAVINIWETIRDAAIAIFEAVAGFLTDTWDWISETAITVWNWLKDTLSSIWNSIYDTVAPIFSAIADFLAATWEVISTTAQAWWNVVTTILSEAWEGLMAIVMPIFNAISDFISSVWGTVSSTSSSVWGTITDVLSTVWGWISDTALTIFGYISDFLTTIWEPIRDTITTVWGFISDYLSHLWTLIVDIAVAVFEPIAAFFSGIWNTISDVTSTVWDGITSALSSVWEMIKTLASGNFDSVRDIIDIVWNTIKDVTSTVWDTIRNIFSTVVRGIVNTASSWFSSMQDSIVSIFTAISTFFSNIWSTIRNTFQRLIRIIVNFVRDRWNGTLDTTRNIFNSISTFFSNIWSSIRDAISNFVTRIWNNIRDAWNNTMSTTRNIFNRLFNWLSDLWDSLWSTVTGFADDIWSGVSDAWDSLWSSTRRMFNRIKNWISDTFDDIVDWAKELPGRIGDAISNMASAAVDGAKSMINSMADSLEEGVNFVIGGLNDLLSAIGLSVSIDELSIPRLARGTNSHPGGPAMVNDGRGPELIKTPGNHPGFVSGQNRVVNLPRGSKVASYEKSNRMMGGNLPAYSGGIGSWASNAWDNVTSFGSDVWDGITGTASAAWDFLSDGASAAIDGLFDMVGFDIPDGDDFLSGLGRGVIEQIKEGLIGFTDAQTMAFSDFQGIDFGDAFTRTSGYGWRVHPITGDRRHHSGVDYAAPMGTPYPAQASGRVVTSGWAGGLGNLVEIQSGNILYRYGHNSKNLVGVGDEVSRGDMIAEVGSTGNSTGPHVHFEIHEDGESQNPETWTPPTSDPGGSGVQRWRSVIQQASARMNANASSSDISAILSQIQLESGGNEKAVQSPGVNDINMRMGNPAQGLLQYIPSTFAAYSMPGHSNILSGFDQLLAFFNNSTWRRDNPGGTRGWSPEVREGSPVAVLSTRIKWQESASVDRKRLYRCPLIDVDVPSNSTAMLVA
ncbi:phage tail tape measure protein [Salicibibacter cibarius]|uniref:Phage tail tape measure protein n=1 Tax=Salicibibacter cibarius TaxID=2743000 RepID=A0A7T6Z1J1_9BACI|nr:phage tail tape measure protein [Salicibibacter cibarius]QQK75098.1 phage tail tape measure protein [Salicibibacter cibarius]